MRLIDYVCMSAISVALAACSSFALNDPHWVLDPPNHNLRGPKPKDDRPESDCDPEKQSDGSLKYKCVVHTFENYGALLKEIDRLGDAAKGVPAGEAVTLTIDWSNPDAKISKHFTVKEAIYLSKWGRLAYEGDGLNDHVKKCILRFAAVADGVRDYLGHPMYVHCWFRPKGYNALVGGAKASKHMSLGDHSAIDFHCIITSTDSQAESCDTIRAALEPRLSELGIRMERNPGTGWVHIDDAEVVTERYFRP